MFFILPFPIPFISCDNNTAHPRPCGRRFCLGPYPRRCSSADCPGHSGRLGRYNHIRSPVGLCQSHCDNDGGAVCCRRSHIQYRPCQNARSPLVETRRQFADEAFPCRRAGHRPYRRLRQQHRYGGADASHSGVDGCGVRHIALAHADAAGFRIEHRRHAHPHRHTSQPCYCRGVGRGRQRSADHVHLPACRSGMSCGWHVAAHSHEPVACQG